MEVSRKDLLEIMDALNRLSAIVRNVKMSYAIAKNLTKIKSEKSAIDKASEPPKTDEYKAYEAARKAVAVEMCLKDKEGNPVIVGNEYSFARNKLAALDAAMDKVKAEHQKVADELEAKQKEVDELLNETIDFEFHTVNYDLLEKDNALTDDAKNLGAILAPLLGTVINEP